MWVSLAGCGQSSMEGGLLLSPYLQRQGRKHQVKMMVKIIET